MMGLLRNPKHYRALMAAWLAKARTHPAVHPEHAGSIGYCIDSMPTPAPDCSAPSLLCCG